MAEKDLAYYMANENEFNALTEEQVIALSEGHTVEGETAAPKEEAAEDVESPAHEAEAKEPVVEEENVLLAKDGKHIIPFERLQEMTEKAAQWEAFAREQAALVESMKQAKAEDAETGGTKAQEAVIAEYAGDFPEVFEDLKGHFQSMIDAKVTAKMTELEAKLDNVIAPMQQQAEDNSREAHFAAIKSVINDFDQLVDSGVVEDWIKTQPSYVQKAANQVLYGIPGVKNSAGTASEVIELFSNYKASQPNKQAAPSKDDLNAKANAVIAKAKAKTPTSLTDVPSGTSAAIDDDAAEAGMNAQQLFAKYQGMPPEKILKSIARAI